MQHDIGDPDQSVHSRARVYFEVAGARCAAWHYRGLNGSCVVMAGGLAMPKEPGTDMFAARFHQAGYSVFTFDYRHLGESAGLPRGVVRVRDQIAVDADRALNPENKYPSWSQTVAARSALPLGRYRPGRDVANVSCPLLIVVCDSDKSALAEPAIRAANNAPNSELIRMPGGHYEPFLNGHDYAVEAELDFLQRHLARHADTTAS
jgi:fermentation-respiration switch protein FrsA (DUF1100 family)